MYKSLKSALQQNDINFPKHWDQKLSVEFFLTTDSEDLAEELRVTAANAKKWLKEMFPNKPANVSVNKYLKSIISTIEAKPSEEYSDPTPQQVGLSFRKST